MNSGAIGRRRPSHHGVFKSVISSDPRANLEGMLAYRIEDEQGQEYYLSLQGGTLTLSRESVANYTFDGEGRPHGAWIDGLTYRRALDNRVLVKWPGGPGQGRNRRFLDDNERRHLFARIFSDVRGIGEAILAPSARQPADFPMEVAQPWLQRVLSWDWSKLEAERERFYAVYKPVPIMPPDQYLAVVFQATEGCSYNRCTFCTFYRGRPFRIKTAAEFREHVQAVRSFLGRGLAMRRSIFLADADALIIRQKLLLEMLSYLNQQVAILSPNLTRAERLQFKRKQKSWFNGIYAFITASDVLRKSAADYSDLATLGLRRVYIGLESGHDPLLRWLRKPNDASTVVKAVQRLHSGRIPVGLVLMTGVGGDRFASGHVQDSVAILAKMPLTKQDIVYFSPFVPDEGSEYVAEAVVLGVHPLSRADMLVQETIMRRQLRQAGVQAQFSRYDIREFVY